MASIGARQVGFARLVKQLRGRTRWVDRAGVYPRAAGKAMPLSGWRAERDESRCGRCTGTPSAERPAGELVKQLSEQVSALVREELKLAGDIVHSCTAHSHSPLSSGLTTARGRSSTPIDLLW